MNRAPFEYDEDGEATTIVERIYVTRGDNSYDEDNVKNDKMIGIVIKGDIYWLERDFARFSELSYELAGFNILITEDGRWGVTDEDGRTVLANKVTKISKHHDDILSEKSSYLKRSKRNDSNGRLFWETHEVLSHFFGKEEEEVKPFVQGDAVVWRNEFGTVEGNFRGLVPNEDKAVIVHNGSQMAAPINELQHA